MSWLSAARHADVVTITFDRPAARNAIPPEGWLELEGALRSITATDRVLVLRGTNGDFSAGGDVTRFFEDLDVPSLMADIRRTVLTLHSLPIPSIAVVDGVAIGAGMALALACDFVVTTSRARFGAPFVRRGVTPDSGASWLLPRLVGIQRAKHLMLLGEIIDAATAERLQLVHSVVAPEALEAELANLISKLVANGRQATSLTKALVTGSFERGLDEALQAEATASALSMTSAEVQAAVAAFLERKNGPEGTEH